MSEAAFLMAGHDIIGNKISTEDSNSRRFRTFFGTSPKTCSLLWKLLEDRRPDDASPHHMLFSLLFLKTYGTSQFHASLAHCDEKTFRKYQWHYIRMIADLEVVSTPIAKFLLR